MEPRQRSMKILSYSFGFSKIGRTESIHVVIMQRTAKNEQRFITHAPSHCSAYKRFVWRRSRCRCRRGLFTSSLIAVERKL